MGSLSNSQLLDLWENGAKLHPLDRGLLALSLTHPQEAAETLADWALGRRNRALLELHARLFGERLQAWSACAACGEKMEISLEWKAFIEGSAAEDTPTIGNNRFRLLTTRDLAEAGREADIDSAALCLVRRCALDPADFQKWSSEEIEQLGDRLAAADPLAEIRLALVCPACQVESIETIELTTFLWTEIEARAKALLREVHIIASAYGWTENEILRLSSARRAHYVEMARA
jgi:hypothetical protein